MKLPLVPFGPKKKQTKKSTPLPANSVVLATASATVPKSSFFFTVNGVPQMVDSAEADPPASAATPPPSHSEDVHPIPLPQPDRLIDLNFEEA